MSHPAVEVTVHQRSSEDPAEALPPEPVVTLRAPLVQRSGGQMPRKQRVADSEAPESVLEPRRLAGEKHSSPRRAPGRKELPGSGEAARVGHAQPGLAPEELDRAVQI